MGKAERANLIRRQELARRLAEIRTHPNSVQKLVEVMLLRGIPEDLVEQIMQDMGHTRVEPTVLLVGEYCRARAGGPLLQVIEIHPVGPGGKLGSEYLAVAIAADGIPVAGSARLMFWTDVVPAEGPRLLRALAPLPDAPRA